MNGQQNKTFLCSKCQLECVLLPLSKDKLVSPSSRCEMSVWKLSLVSVAVLDLSSGNVPVTTLGWKGQCLSKAVKQYAINYDFFSSMGLWILEAQWSNHHCSVICMNSSLHHMYAAEDENPDNIISLPALHLHHSSQDFFLFFWTRAPPALCGWIWIGVQHTWFISSSVLVSLLSFFYICLHG